MKILNRFGLELDKVQLNKTDLSLIRDNLSVYNQFVAQFVQYLLCTPC